MNEYADKLNCIKCRPSIGYVSPKILDGNYEGGWNKDYKNSPPTLGSVWIDIHVDSGWGYVKGSRLVSPKQLCKECYDARVKELESKMFPWANTLDESMMKTYEIKSHLKELGLEVSGSRKECLQRLEEALK